MPHLLPVFLDFSPFGQLHIAHTGKRMIPVGRLQWFGLQSWLSSRKGVLELDSSVAKREKGKGGEEGAQVTIACRYILLSYFALKCCCWQGNKTMVKESALFFGHWTGEVRTVHSNWVERERGGPGWGSILIPFRLFPCEAQMVMVFSLKLDNLQCVMESNENRDLKDAHGNSDVLCWQILFTSTCNLISVTPRPVRTSCREKRDSQGRISPDIFFLFCLIKLFCCW